MKIINVVGARPNLMKIAPLMRAFARHSEVAAEIIHTGQHYDKNLSAWKRTAENVRLYEPVVQVSERDQRHIVRLARVDRFESKGLAADSLEP